MASRAALLLRLPEHYQRFLAELKKQPSPVHYRPILKKWQRNPETGEIKPVENIPLPLLSPPESNQGIWGGEAVVRGFVRKGRQQRRVPRFWVPVLKKAVVYSEILNRYMTLTVTERTLQLIDRHYGFDKYILETPVQDLRSQLALDLRREMLLTLARREMYPDDLEKQEAIYQKYKQHIIPVEEAEWFGLSLNAAIEKLKQQEAKQPVPLKHRFRSELIQQLNEMKAEGKLEDMSESSENSWLSRLNPFARQKQSD